MKNIIKFIIALFFILGSFFIGKYYGLEKNKTEISELNVKVSDFVKKIKVSESRINKLGVENTELKDSISDIIKKQGITKNIVHLADSAKNEHFSNK